MVRELVRVQEPVPVHWESASPVLEPGPDFPVSDSGSDIPVSGKFQEFTG